jgi:threonyl-tRNA synthetase
MKKRTKIREAQLHKFPTACCGDKEVEDGTISVRRRSEGDLGAMPADDFAALL